MKFLNSWEGLNSTFELAEEGISKLEDRSIEIMQTEEQREEKELRERILREMWDTFHTNIHIGSTRREEREKSREKYMKKNYQIYWKTTIKTRQRHDKKKHTAS